MSDIVERLRSADGLDGGDALAPLCHEAADEIERLNRVVIRGLAGVELSEENDRLIEQGTQLRDEIRRLTRELEEERSLISTTMVERLRAEIERLRAVIQAGSLCDPINCTFGNAHRVLEGK